MKNEKEPIEKYKLELKELPALAAQPYTKITCPSCQKDLPADHLNINDKIAKCGECHVVFPFHETIAQFDTGKPAEKQAFKQELIRPEGIDISYFRNEMDISIQQIGGWGWVLFFMVILAVMITIGCFKEGTYLWLPAITWLFTLYPLFNLANHSKHKIFVNIDDHYLTIKWRPKNFMKDRSYNIREIDQVYVKKIPETGYYDIYIIVNASAGQKHVKVIPMFSSMSKARYVEQEMERHLGITDRVVLEEYKSKS